MITLVCTKCGNTLTVDDGFAGGVCRCSKCGTIQTVPARGEQQAVGGEAIFERATRGAPGASGRPGSSSKDLEALSEIVTSSGLIGSGMLRHSRPTAEAIGLPEVRRNRSTVIAAILGIVVAALVSAWLAMGIFRAGQKDGEERRQATAVAPAPVAATPIAGPSFGSIPLDVSGPVIYLVDRGDATRAYTASLQRAVARSVASLGSTRKFQVRYWTADGETPVFPSAPAEATPATLAKLNAWMADVPGGSATDASESLDSALAVAPGAIVILTGKSWQLDDSFANAAIVKLGAANKTRVDAVALGGSAGSDALARVVAKTGGHFVEMDDTTLAAIGK